jgi:WD40 repeat protein
VPELRLLLSGGSDKDVRAWDLEAFSSDTASTKPLVCLASAKGQHTRPIEVLASFPILAHSKDTDENSPTGSIGIWSADSMGRITVWKLDREAQMVNFVPQHTWIAHETAIYDIKLVGESEAWTASSDQLATCWSFNPTDVSIPPIATIRLPHPYYVKSILPLEGLVPGPAEHYVLTGSTDEQIRVWDTSALDTAPTKAKKTHMTSAADASDQYKDGKKPAGLVADLEGHFHEVNRLALWSGRVQDIDEKDELYVISTGLDCTLRKWKVGELVAKAPKRAAGLKEVEASPEPALTEEEERELAELMED